MSAPGGPRIAWLDVLKGVAITLVVLNHSLLWPMRAGNRAAAFVYGVAFGTVAAFAAVAGYVQGMRPPHPVADVLPHRVRQLMVPWLVWAPLYAVVPLVWRAVGGGELPIGMEPWPWARAVLLGGGPLWFLPVLAVATIMSAAMDVRGERTWWPVWIPVAAYVAIVALAVWRGASPIAVGAGTFWAVSPLYLASHWFGVRVARDRALPRGRALSTLRPGVLWAVVGVSMVSGGACTLAREVTHQVVWSWLVYPVGAVGGWAALLLAVRARREPAGPMHAFERLGHASLGVYVLHPLLIGGALLTLPSSWGVGASLVACAVALPLAWLVITRARKHLPWVRKVL